VVDGGDFEKGGRGVWLEEVDDERLDLVLEDIGNVM